MIKKVLISIGHPAQYHFFKHTIRQLQADGLEVKVVIKTKDVLESLLQADGVPYVNVQTTVRRNNKLSILTAALRRSWAVLKLALPFKPDILLGTGADVAHTAWVMRKPCITTLEDDVDIIRHLARMTYPFTTHILVPHPCRVGQWEAKKVGYPGYMKLAYLHPNRFTPDAAVPRRYGLDTPYMLLRMVQLTAYHDEGVKGLTVSAARQVVEMAEASGVRVCISAECELPADLKRYRLSINPADMHHLMAGARLLVSDSQSMSVEAAMLGVPNLRYSSFASRISVLEELEHTYGLTCGIAAGCEASLLNELQHLLATPALAEEFANRRARMLHDKIDVTAFLTWYVEHYPESQRLWSEMPNHPAVPSFR